MKFYKDKGETFSCELEIEGAAISESKVRLVLDFDQDRTYLFEGKIKDDGVCEVQIPALKEISSKKGKAQLEVIAESTFFTPWESDFVVETSKTVGIKEVRLSNQSTDTLSEVRVKPTNQVKSKPKPKQLALEVKKTISDKNKKLVHKALQQFAKMSPKEKNQILETVNKFVPSKTMKNWSDRTFVSENQITKVCTYLISEGLTILGD